MELVTATDIIPPAHSDEGRYRSIIGNQRRAIAIFREQIDRMDPNGNTLDIYSKY